MGEPTARRSGETRTALLLVAACVLAYLPGLSSPFTRYDDSIYIYLNEVIGRPGLPGFLLQWDSSRAWSGSFVEYFPLRDSVYWALYQLWGTAVAPYHLVSLLAHVLATLGAWRLASRIGLSPWAAAFAAALFAVHPVHLESVVWAAGLKDPMYTALMIWGLVAYARYRESPRPGWYALTLLALCAAMLVKSMAMVMPLLMVAMERWVGRPTPWSELARRLAGPALITFVWVVQFVLIGKAANVLAPPHGGSWAAHVVLTAWAQVVYLQQSLVPYNVRFIYCFPPPHGLLDWRLGVAVAVAAGVVALVVHWRHSPRTLLAVTWYFACLLPVSNLIPFPTVMQDRYLYAALLGVTLLTAEAMDRLDLRLRTVLGPLAVLLLCGVTAARASLWNEEERLWEDPDLDPACMQDQSFPAAQTHLLHFWTATDPEVRMGAFERLIAHPGYLIRPVDEVCTSMAQAIHLAVKHHQPDRAGGWVVTAASRCPTEGYTWNAIAAFHLHRRPRKAMEAADRAARLDPRGSFKAMAAVAHLEAGEPDARRLLQRVVTEDPTYACPVLRQFNSEVGKHLQDQLVDILEPCPP